MFKYYLLILSIILTPVTLASAESDLDSVSFATYYPAPYGNYKEMRTMRMAIGDNYIKTNEYNWETGATNLIDSNADLIVEGNVGIGIASPKAKLDVNGGIKVGPMDNTNNNCATDQAGSMRYNTTSKQIEFCEGSNWQTLGGTTAAPGRVEFSSNGTWTCPPGVMAVTVEAIGGGGSGGGTGMCAGSGYPGGAGQIVTKEITVIPDTAYTVTVGAGAWSGNGGPGVAGGSSTLGIPGNTPLATASGGAAGAYAFCENPCTSGCSGTSNGTSYGAGGRGLDAGETAGGAGQIGHLVVKWGW